MCTAILARAGDGYFGRNLDFESDFGEKIVVVPRNFGFTFRSGREIKNHHAIVGMAVVDNGYPLLFDAINEAGLGIAGLRFAGNAEFKKAVSGKDNVASYEFISWVLTNCASVDEAESFLSNANITDDAYSAEMPPSPLHWIIADNKRALTVEQTKSGLKIYENNVGVLTNNPEFSVQIQNLTNYMNLSAKEPTNLFSEKLYMKPYSRGMGAIGLPGDYSSMSRFVKACFICENSVYSSIESEVVNHFFHTLYAVYQQKGCVQVQGGYEITNYTSCCNLSKGIYYYTTYNNSCINAIDMHKEYLNGDRLAVYELLTASKIVVQNQYKKR